MRRESKRLRSSSLVATAAKTWYNSRDELHISSNTKALDDSQKKRLLRYVVLTTISQDIHTRLLARWHENQELYVVIVEHFDQHCPVPDPPAWNCVVDSSDDDSLLVGKMLALQNVAIVMSEWMADEWDGLGIESKMRGRLSQLVTSVNEAVPLSRLRVNTTIACNRCYELTTSWITGQSVRLAQMWYLCTQFHSRCQLWQTAHAWQRLLYSRPLLAGRCYTHPASGPRAVVLGRHTPRLVLPFAAAEHLARFVGSGVAFVGRVNAVRRASSSGTTDRDPMLTWSTWYYDALFAPLHEDDDEPTPCSNIFGHASGGSNNGKEEYDPAAAKRIEAGAAQLLVDVS